MLQSSSQGIILFERRWCWARNGDDSKKLQWIGQCVSCHDFCCKTKKGIFFITNGKLLNLKSRTAPYYETKDRIIFIHRPMTSRSICLQEPMDIEACTSIYLETWSWSIFQTLIYPTQTGVSPLYPFGSSRSTFFVDSEHRSPFKSSTFNLTHWISHRIF